MTSTYPNKELTAAGVAVLDCEHRTPKAQTQGFPYIAIPDVVSGRIDLSTSRRISEEDLANWTKRTVPQGGDVLVTRRGRVGDTAPIPDGLRCAIGQNLVLLRSDGKEVRQDFLRWASRSPQWWSEVERLLNVGAIFSSLNVRDIARIKVPVPPMAEQQGIVQVLGALDDKIAADDQVARMALELGNSIFDRMYSASTVTPTQLGELVERGGLVLGDGYRTKRSEHGQPGLRILRAGDVRDGLIDPVGDDFVSQSFARQIGPKMSQSGDIVMTTKGTVGRVAVVSSETERLVYSPQLCYFRVVDNGILDRGYLAAWFRSADLQCQASLRMFKSDMAPYINLQDIRSLEVPIVPFEQQRQQGDTQLKLLELFDGASAEMKRLVRLRDTLLPQLMSGRIRVRDAEQTVGDVV